MAQARKEVTVAKGKAVEAPGTMPDFPESIHLDLKRTKHKVPKVEPGEKITVHVTGKVESFRMDKERFSVGLEIEGVEFEVGSGSASDLIRKKQARHRGE